MTRQCYYNVEDICVMESFNPTAKPCSFKDDNGRCTVEEVDLLTEEEYFSLRPSKNEGEK